MCILFFIILYRFVGISKPSLLLISDEVLANWHTFSKEVKKKMSRNCGGMNYMMNLSFPDENFSRTRSQWSLE